MMTNHINLQLRHGGYFRNNSWSDFPLEDFIFSPAASPFQATPGWYLMHPTQLGTL